MKLQIEDIIKATGGRCLNRVEFGKDMITSITTDSRNVPQSSLFVPLCGERFDGHDFIDKLFDLGACVTLTEQNAIKDDRITHIWVADTKKALLDLAAYYRNCFDIPVVAVTGSVGKTTTKDLIASVLGSKFKVLKTQGNFNNEIGLPLTVFGLDESYEMAVLEMGMNHFNEIHNLTMAAMPNVAVITNVGTSHIENLGSREGILKAKLEILDGLAADGLFVVNGDDEYLGQISEVVHATMTCGLGLSNTYYAKEIRTSQGYTYATVCTPKESYEITIPALGEHMVYNSLVAIAIAEHFKLEKNEILVGLLAYMPSKMRMNITTHPNTITVMDDTYNASPDSMLAALKVLSQYECKGRRVAILGDMFEMGEHAPLLHAQVGSYVAELPIDILYCVGDLARYIKEGAIKHKKENLDIKYYEDKQMFIDAIQEELNDFDTVLIKASRGMHFEQIVKAIGKVEA